MIVLSELQNKALKSIYEWYSKNEKPYYVLGGIAGSGKSTVVKFVIEELGINKFKLATYTGKAATVLLTKGNKEACTIHRLIYNTKIMKDPKTGKKKYITTLKEKEELSELELIIIDEYSFLNNKIIEDLLSFDVPILFCGDPCQLPPITGENKLKMDFFLDEPHRQALEDPIFLIANYARLGEFGKIKIGKYGDNVEIYSSMEFPMDKLENSDQIIACKNKTVDSLNTFYRYQFLEYKDNLIHENEKVVCCMNDWDKVNEEEFALVNGMVGIASEIKIKEKAQVYHLNFKPDFTTKFTNVYVDKLLFEGKTLENANIITKLARNPIEELNKLNEFKYAYAMTCHKLQGSEANNIIFFPEALNRDRELYKKLFYTGVTRAKEKLIIVL